MNKDPGRRPPADSPDPSAEATPSGSLDDSPKGTPGEPHGEDLEPRYTIENLEAWARDLTDWAAWETDPDGNKPGQPSEVVDDWAASAVLAARFLSETAAVLRRQREDRTRRAARAVIESRKTRKAQRRRGRRG